MAKRSTVTGVDKLVSKVGKVSELKVSEATELAREVTLEMKKLISKGVSPIKQTGRFPEYLAAGAIKDAITANRKEAAAYRKTLSDDLKTLKGKKGDRENALRASYKAERDSFKNSSAAKEATIKKRGYPYSVQDKYPGKKPRPVNLNLSGKFLSDLQGRPKGGGKNVSAEVGIYGKLSVAKEKGHREGANGQPSRPIIPDYTKGERFTDVIRMKIERYFKQLIKKNTK